MKLKLDDINIKSFVTKESNKVKAGAAPATEAWDCTYPQVCGVYTDWGCATNNCPSDWGGCGPTGLC